MRGRGSGPSGRAYLLLMIENLEQLIQDLHDSEINAEIGWFYDGVCWVKICDELIGFGGEGRCGSLAEATEWLRATAVRLNPESLFAKRHRRGFE
jgi:hypothetical protein